MANDGEGGMIMRDRHPPSAGPSPGDAPRAAVHLELVAFDSEGAPLDALIARIAQGDARAFEETYRRTSAKLFGVCLRIVANRSQAEEALQEAYLAVWRRAASFDAARGGAMTWLITLARNRAIDRLRASRPIGTVAMDLAIDVADPRPLASAMLESDETERRLASCLDTLDGGDASLIRTAFLQGSTYAELAARTARPLGTIKSRVRRALLMLRDCLA